MILALFKVQVDNREEWEAFPTEAPLTASVVEAKKEEEKEESKSE